VHDGGDEVTSGQEVTSGLTGRAGGSPGPGSSHPVAAYLSPLQPGHQRILFRNKKSGGWDSHAGSGAGGAGREEWKEGEDVVAMLEGGGNSSLRDPYHLFSPM
jgi:hypothetical protein